MTFRSGVYAAKVLNWGWSESSDGLAIFWLTFEVVGEVDRTRPKNEPLTRESGFGGWRIAIAGEEDVAELLAIMRTLGYGGEGLLGLDPDGPNAFDFSGVDFFAICELVDDAGEFREKWTIRKKGKLPQARLVRLHEQFFEAVATQAMQAAGDAVSPEDPPDPVKIKTRATKFTAREKQKRTGRI